MPLPSSILLIDDSPGERELSRLALARSGMNVPLYEQSTPESALHFLKARLGSDPLPSLILLDWKLSGASGGDFLRHLRTDARFAQVPVIIFTTSDDPADIQAGVAAGANAYVVKPARFDDLVTCIRDLCSFWLQWNRLEAHAAC